MDTLRVWHACCKIRVFEPLSTCKIVGGDTALHWACYNEDETLTISIVSLLLQAGAKADLTANYGDTPLGYLRQHRPTHYAAIALLEQYPETQKDAEKASLFVKASRPAASSSSAGALQPRRICKAGWHEASPCRTWC